LLLHDAHCASGLIAPTGALFDSGKRLSSSKVSPQTGAFVQID
jgi:hypothetical protein